MSNKNKGIMFIVISAFCFALMNTFVKLSGDLPSIQKSFFRNLVALGVAFVILKRSGQGFHIEKEHLPLLIGRSTCGLLGIIFNFYAVDHLLLADASMLNKLAPFFVIIFSFFLLKEKITALQLGALVVAFLGSLFIIKPSFANADVFPAFIAVLGAMTAGAAYTLVRKLGLQGVKGPLIVFFFSTFSCVAVLPYLLFNYHSMSTEQIGWLLAAGVAAAGGQFAITSAYHHAPAKEISVFDYSQVIFAAIMGFMLFGQVPDGWSFIGYGIICSVAVIMLIYNNREERV